MFMFFFSIIFLSVIETFLYIEIKNKKIIVFLDKKYYEKQLLLRY